MSNRHLFFILILSLFFVNAQAQTRNKKLVKKYYAEVEKCAHAMTYKSDSTTYFNQLLQLADAVIECDNEDMKPDKKGNINPRFTPQLKTVLSPAFPKLQDAVAFYWNKDKRKALDIQKQYISTSHSHLLPNEKTDLGRAYLNAGVLAYDLQEFSEAESFANEALEYENYAQKAAELKLFCMKKRLKTANDSTKYIIALLELHDKDPQNHNYFSMLMDYFTTPGHEQELGLFAKDEIQKNPNNAQAWALKGEAEMHHELWDEAIESYKHAVEIEPQMTQAVFNIGLCYATKAKDLQDNLTKKKKRLTKSEAKTLKNAYQEAKTWLEKAKNADPNQEKVKWEQPLQQVNIAINH